MGPVQTALRTILAAEQDYDNILCLGDLVDYGPQPLEKVMLHGDHRGGLIASVIATAVQLIKRAGTAARFPSEARRAYYEKLLRSSKQITCCAVSGRCV